MHTHQRITNLAPAVILSRSRRAACKNCRTTWTSSAHPPSDARNAASSARIFSRSRLPLRDLRFVMRENVIHAAAMNIDLFAEQCRRHRAALDVPAGSPAPHGLSHATSPSSSSHAFQSAKSPMCSLSYSSFRTRPVDCNCVKIEMRQLSVVRKIVDPEINRFVFRLIRQLARRSSSPIISIIFCDILRFGRGRKSSARLMRSVSRSSKNAL